MFERFKIGIFLVMFVIFASKTSLSVKSNWTMITIVKNILFNPSRGSIHSPGGSQIHTGLDANGCPVVLPAPDSIPDPIRRWKWGLIANWCLGVDGADTYWNTPLQRALLARSLYYSAKLGNISAYDERMIFLRMGGCQSAEECFFLGRILMEQGKILAAISYLEHSIIEPVLWSTQYVFDDEKVQDIFSLFNVHMNLARSFLLLEQLDRARDVYHRAVDLKPQSDVAWRELGWVYYKSTKSLEPALTYFLRAVELNESAQNWFAIADLYSLTNSLDRALYYADLGGEFGAPATAELVKARAYLRASQPARALDSAYKALELGAVKADTFVILGEVYLELGQWNDAVKSYQQAMLLKPEAWEILCRLAHVYQLAKQDLDAEREFLRARQLDPTGKGCLR